MLDRMRDSLPHRQFKDVLEEVGKMSHPKYSPVPDSEVEGRGEKGKHMDRVEFRQKDAGSEGSGSTNMDL